MTDNDPSSADPLGQIADEFVERSREDDRSEIVFVPDEVQAGHRFAHLEPICVRREEFRCIFDTSLHEPQTGERADRVGLFRECVRRLGPERVHDLSLGLVPVSGVTEDDAVRRPAVCVEDGELTGDARLEVRPAALRPLLGSTKISRALTRREHGAEDQ